jgi:hypothetical protein
VIGLGSGSVGCHGRSIVTILCSNRHSELRRSASFTVATHRQYACTRLVKLTYRRWTHSSRTATSSWQRYGSGSNKHINSTRRSTTASTGSSTSWSVSGHSSASCTVQLCRSMSRDAANSGLSSSGPSRSLRRSATWPTGSNCQRELVYTTCSMSVCSRSSMVRHRPLRGPFIRYDTAVRVPLRSLFCAADWPSQSELLV